MSGDATRREFLRRSAFGCGGLATALTAVWTGRAARAIEPIKRNGKSFFKFSLAAYSYRDLLNAKPPKTKLTLEDFISDCAKMGLEGTELTSYYFPEQPTNEYLRHLKQHCFRLGLDVSGTAVGNDFCHPAGEARDRELEHVKRWVDHAEILGAPVIRIFSGQPHGTSEEEARRLCVAAIEECCQYAGEHGVFLALENHGGLTTSVEGILELVRAVQSPWFGVNLDTGNFHQRRRVCRYRPVGPVRGERASEGFDRRCAGPASTRRFSPAGARFSRRPAIAAMSCWSSRRPKIRWSPAHATSMSCARHLQVDSRRSARIIRRLAAAVPPERYCRPNSPIPVPYPLWG